MHMSYTVFVARFIDQEQAMVCIKIVPEYLELEIAGPDISDPKIVLMFRSGHLYNRNNGTKIIDCANGRLIKRMYVPPACSVAG